ncbi:MAG TPA: ABC-2 family transporter protein [Limnochordia bacterium]|nr:ABC-2 family transporter protein [Limnochordia bacterium]
MRYLRIWARFFAFGLMREMQYRASFYGEAVAQIAQALLFLLFIQTLLGQVDAIGGWSKPEMEVLYGTFVLLNGCAQGLIATNVWRIPELVRLGTLDLVLTKPIDAQYWVSVRNIEPGELLGGAIGLIIIGVGLAQTGGPGLIDILAYALALACALVIVYSLWFISVLYAFWAVKLDSIGALFVPILQLARYPVTAYPPRLGLILRSALPVVFFAGVPARALLGRPGAVLWAPLAAALCLAASRVAWRFASRRYGSAGS